ncbi:PKD domain-containing protein [Chitinimonas taiwanensis]|uniref:PKD domain-containing protein n=1 Tax=Chitinimonas taiwanensis TaxID=240412 RepID=UPI0035B17C55
MIGDEGRQIVAGLVTSLHGYVTDGSGVPRYQWTQESGPKVTLIDGDTATLRFTAPVVSSNTILSFELRASDDKGVATPAKVAVTVVPAANVGVTVGYASRLAQVGHSVSLHASGSAPGLRYAWRQLSPAAPVVALTGADTDNPSFVAPILPAGGRLLFEVTATDPATGRNASARAAVDVQYPVPNPVPHPVPGQVPQPIPIATPLLQPLLIAQPFLAPQSNVAVPLPNPVLVPPLVPPQALVLTAPPAVVATGGTTVQLGATVTGGRAPYQWQWQQTSGPAAALVANGQAVVDVQVPVVTSTQTLTFTAQVTDANGTRRSAEAVIQATLVPQAVAPTDLKPTPLVVQAPRLVTVTEPAPVFSTPLTGVSFGQTSGPRLQITQQPATGGGTTLVVTAPLLKEDSAHATLTVTGKDAKGQTRAYIVPVIVMRPPALAPALVAPPQVPIPTPPTVPPQVPPQVPGQAAPTLPPVLTPPLVPKQDDPLVIMGRLQGSVDEGRQDAGVMLFARGGKGMASYSYRWDYLKEPGGPDLVLRTPTRPAPGLDVPLVDHPTTLRFLFQVTDGAQVAQATYELNINDLAPTENVGTLPLIVVDSAHAVTLSMPRPSGGIPFAPPAQPYTYSIAQKDGPALPVPPQPTSAGAGNWGFNAPVVSANAGDQELTFEMTATDRSGSAVKLTQKVIVAAPGGLRPYVSLPSIVNLVGGAAPTLQLAGAAAGGTAPYSYAWTVRQEVTPIPGKAGFSLPDLTATGQNPSVGFDDLGARRSEAATYRLVATLKVTDAAGDSAELSREVDVPLYVKTELVRGGSEVLLCGDEATSKPCTDLDLVLAMTSRCPDSQPFGMNIIKQDGAQVQEYRQCVDAIVAYQKFVVGGSKHNPLCRNYDQNAQTKLECYLACYGDGCNIDTNPPDDVLVGPPGPDGKLTVGVPPLP